MVTDKKQMLPVGTLLQGGKYRVERYLSSGGFGNTYIIVNTKFDDQFALKEFYMRDINEREEDNTVSVSNPGKKDQFNSQMRKFEREARRLYKIHNEHIVKVHDLFDENGTCYYVMDLIQGESLHDRLKRTGCPLQEEETWMILNQLLDALEVVHNQHIWHLDIKPGNILLDNNGKVMLIDFGASKQLEGNDGLATTTKSMTATLGYAPIEQLGQKLDHVGPWSDFYALGATLYNLLTMNTPPDANEILENKDILCFPSNVSPKMRQLVYWMMKINRSERPQSVNDIRRFISNNRPNDNEETIVLESVNNNSSEKTQIIDKDVNKTAKAINTVEMNTNSIDNDKKFVLSPIFRKKSSVRKWVFGGLCIVAIAIIFNSLIKHFGESGALLSTEDKNAIIENLKANMVHVEGGTFLMGEQTDKNTNATPQHEVTVSSFSIGKYEVTQEEWLAVMDKNPSYFKEKDNSKIVYNVTMGKRSKYAKHPVENVSWNECQQFIAKLNEITGLHFRLPTEAEWEYAAIGGNKSKWYFFSGSNSIDSVGWWNDLSTHEVGQKHPNELGIYDMSGNVEEWCSDFYGAYSAEAQVNPKGPASETNGLVQRGGNYGAYDGKKCSVFARSNGYRDLGTSNTGLRLVLSE